jgi:thymidylate synthase
MSLRVENNSIGATWQTLLNEVYNKGGTTVDDGIELSERINVIVDINFPITPVDEDEFLQENMDPEKVEWMDDNFHSMEPVEGWGYSYGSRFRDFGGENQIDYVKSKLTEKPTSKSATISLMNPPEDRKHVPCICTLDFKLRDGLVMTAFFRSQDIGKKFYADMIALKKIMDEVADHLDVDKNQMEIHIASAHIYENDYDTVEDILN